MPQLEAGLADGLAVLGLSLTPVQQATLLAYLRLLGKWNQVYNLTAVRDPQDMLTHHLLDSLAALRPARSFLNELPLERRAVLDVGSGGGLPGVAWSISEPDWAITCVDAVAKKTGFIRQVSAELGLKHLHARHSRVEDLHADTPWPLITSRAFASLADFTRLTAHLLASQGVWMALKGRHPTDEIADLPPSVEVFHVEPLQVPGLDAERCLVWMRPR